MKKCFDRCWHTHLLVVLCSDGDTNLGRPRLQQDRKRSALYAGAGGLFVQDPALQMDGNRIGRTCSRKRISSPALCWSRSWAQIVSVPSRQSLAIANPMVS